jgi:hypothetical protein
MPQILAGVLLVEKVSHPSTMSQALAPVENVRIEVIEEVGTPLALVIALESDHRGLIPGARVSSQNAFTALLDPWPARAAFTPVLAL